MPVQRYTWRSGKTNTLCDKCSDEMFLSLVQRVIREHPDLTSDQLQELEPIQELVELDATAVEVPGQNCQPIHTNRLGIPTCFSQPFQDYYDD